MSRKDSVGNKRKKKKSGILGWIVIIAALCVFFYAGYRLYDILHTYKAADDEYASLRDSYTSPAGPTPVPDAGSGAAEEDRAQEGEGGSAAQTEQAEDADPPLAVDFASLKAVNPDVVGWLYVDGEPNISYPICRTDDNDYYLHHTYKKQYLFAGSIFMDYHCDGDFSDAGTILYGHNMRNGSMFGMLKFLDDQEKYDADPYFWILTPSGSYRYHIYSIYHPSVDSDVYTIYFQGGKDFLAWEQRQKDRSEVKNAVQLGENDHTVVLSTCTSDSSRRCVVIGKCVSTAKPPVKGAAAENETESGAAQGH